MTNIVEQIEEMRLVFRISDRDKTVDFYTGVLGLKLINENDFMLEFGTHKNNQIRILCAISPEKMDFHPAKDQKRHLSSILKVGQYDVRQLIVRFKDQIQSTFYSATGYAFSALSPDGDLFTVMSGENGSVAEIPKNDLDLKEDFFVGVERMEILSTMIVSPDARDFYERMQLVQFVHPVPVPSESASETDTWDLGAIQFKLKEGVEIADLNIDLTGLKYNLNKARQLFSLTAPNNLEIQFVK